jgi:hypothetical protein
MQFMKGIYGVEASGDTDNIRMRESVIEADEAAAFSLASFRWGADILLISVHSY